jgi:hypothetical protein
MKEVDGAFAVVVILFCFVLGYILGNAIPFQAISKTGYVNKFTGVVDNWDTTLPYDNGPFISLTSSEGKNEGVDYMVRVNREYIHPVNGSANIDNFTFNKPMYVYVEGSPCWHEAYGCGCFPLTTAWWTFDVTKIIPLGDNK